MNLTIIKARSLDSCSGSELDLTKLFILHNLINEIATYGSQNF